MLAIIIFTFYLIALVVTNKLDFELPKSKTLGHSMEDYVNSKNPQNTADAEYWMNQYLRKNSF